MVSIFFYQNFDCVAYAVCLKIIIARYKNTSRMKRTLHNVFKLDYFGIPQISQLIQQPLFYELIKFHIMGQ